MKKVIKTLIWAALACLAAFAATGALNARYSPAVFFEWDSDCASYAEAKRVLASGDVSANAAVWSVSGDCALYDGDWRLLTGDSLIYGQSGKTMISAGLALERFGCENVVGRETEINAKSYLIDGVYASGVASALIEMGDDYKKHAHMALGFPQSEKAKWYEEADAAREAMGLGRPEAQKDTALLYSLCDMSFIKSLVPTRWADFEGWRDNADALVNRIKAFICAQLAPVQAECLWECLKCVGLLLLAVALTLKALMCVIGQARKNV